MSYLYSGKKMNRKNKGTAAERELIAMLWSKGWAAMRAAGSGSTSFPSPDILAGNKVRRVAIEAKTISANTKYFSSEEIRQLKNFSEYFGAEPWVAIKFARSEWNFFTLDDLKETPKGYSISKKMCDIKGLSFSEFAG